MKKKTKIAVISAVCAAAVAAGTFIGVRISRKSSTVNVYPVYAISTEYWDENGSYGQVTSGSSVSYTKDSNAVSEVYVNAGDEVKEGDVLFSYDTTSLSLSRERAYIDWQLSLVELQKAQSLLDRYRTYTPYVPVEPEVADTLDVVEPDSPTAEGSGDGSSESSPLIYDCTLDTVITAEFFRSIMPEDPAADPVAPGRYVTFNIWHHNDGADSVLIGTWKITWHGTPSGALSHEEFSKYFTIWDLPLSEITGAWVDESTGKAVSSNINEDRYSAFSELIIDTEEQAVLNPPTVPEENSYTQSEIDMLVADQQRTVNSCTTASKQAELDYRRAENAYSDGMVKSPCDGVVTVLSDYGSIAEGEVFMTVSGTSGTVIASTVSELSLGSVSLDQEVRVDDLMTGSTYTGKIIYISDFPASSEEVMGYASNPNTSFYPVQIEIVDAEETPSADTVFQVYFSSGSEVSPLFIPKMMVRKEDGVSYVMAMNDEGLLEKRTVTTGASLYGSYIEIKSGLSDTDCIAFPYGKDVVEGAKCVEDDSLESLYY
ncbi:MAG: biotin/lipoyl-binding protein [Oscillospiraceae bacterium]|jgi:HlyD family secretion protein